jgi:chromosome segregation ATPase
MASPTHPHLVTLNSRAQTTSQTSQKMYFLPSQYSGPDEYLRSQLSTVQSELENEQAARLETEAARLETEAVLSEESLRVRKCIAAYQLLWVAFEQMEIERNRYETQLQDLSIKYQTLAGAVSILSAIKYLNNISLLDFQ